MHRDYFGICHFDKRVIEINTIYPPEVQRSTLYHEMFHAARGEEEWQIEALEEAGATGFISHQPIGKYRYTKRLNERKTVDCVVTVYPMVVEKLKSRWKERKQRKRHWFSPKKAAELVAEPELVEILRTLSIRSERLDTIENMRKAS